MAVALYALVHEAILSVPVRAEFIIEIGVLVMVVEMSLLRPVESGVLSVLQRTLLSVLQRMLFFSL